MRGDYKRKLVNKLCSEKKKLTEIGAIMGLSRHI